VTPREHHGCVTPREHHGCVTPRAHHGCVTPREHLSDSRQPPKLVPLVHTIGISAFDCFPSSRRGAPTNFLVVVFVSITLLLALSSLMHVTVWFTLHKPNFLRFSRDWRRLLVRDLAERTTGRIWWNDHHRIPGKKRMDGGCGWKGRRQRFFKRVNKKYKEQKKR
jgi:hypothetical protein